MSGRVRNVKVYGHVNKVSQVPSTEIATVQTPIPTFRALGIQWWHIMLEYCLLHPLLTMLMLIRVQQQLKTLSMELTSHYSSTQDNLMTALVVVESFLCFDKLLHQRNTCSGKCKGVTSSRHMPKACGPGEDVQ